MKQTHTKTPWIHDSACEKICFYNGIRYEVIFRPEEQSNFKDDVKHIVKCVNSHDELVEALKLSWEYIKILIPENERDLKNCLKIKQALLKAESESL